MYRVKSRTAIDSSKVFADVSVNKKSGKVSTVLNRLVSSNGNPVQALYSKDDLGKERADCTAAAYIELEFEEVPEPVKG